MKGQDPTLQIKTLDALRLAADEKRSVIADSGPCFEHPTPAVVVLNMSGSVIIRLIDAGLYVYRRNGEKRPWPPVKGSGH